MSTPRRRVPMLFIRTIAAIAGLALIAGACSSETAQDQSSDPVASTTTAAKVADDPAGTGTCDDTDPSACLLPWPNDRFTRADSSTPTSRRLDLPTAGMPSNAAGVKIDPAEWNRADGFAPASLLLTYVEGLDVERSKLPPVTDIGQSIQDDSPLALVDLTSGERVGAWAELDANATDPADQLLHIVPAAAMTEGHRYAIGMTNLLITDGTQVEPSEEFTQVVGDDRNADWVDALAKVGLATDELDVGWTFTIASADSLSGRLRAMWAETKAEVGDGAPPFQVDTVNDAGAARVLQGSFEMPNYLTGDGSTGSVFNNEGDPNGIPTRNGTMRSDFTCTVPTAASAAQPSEMVLYGHGLLGDRSEVLDIGITAAAANLSFCALDYIGMSTTDVPTVVSQLEDLTRFRTQADRLQQGHLAFLLLGRLARSAQGFSSNPAFQIEGQSILDTSKAAFLGASQGGILGGVASSLTSDWERVVLAVGGLGYHLLLPRSVNFDRFAPILAQNYPDESVQPLVLDLMQQLWSRGENDGYAQHLTRDPYESTATKSVLILEAFGDHQVANVGTERLARTLQAGSRAPSMAPGRSTDVEPQWGIEPVESYPHRESMLLVWDFGTPAPPVTNTPNRGGDDPHGTYSSLPQALGLLAAFLATGDLSDPCPGQPCRTAG